VKLIEWKKEVDGETVRMRLSSMYFNVVGDFQELLQPCLVSDHGSSQANGD